MTASIIKSAARRHVALTGLQVTAIDSRFVSIAGIKTDYIAALQILNGAGEDSLDFDSFAAALSAI